MQKIKIQQANRSIPKDLEWNEFPRFAIITGKNGSGKSQLLEQMKNPQNWVNTHYIDKDIKHIPAIYNFNINSSTSKSSIIESNNTKKNKIIDSLKMFFTPELKQYIKDNNINMLNLMDIMGKYNYDINLIQGKYPQEYLKLTENNNKAYDQIYFIIQNNRTFDFVTIFKYILEKTAKTFIEDITEQEFLDNLPQDMNNEFTTIGHLKQWFTIYLDDYKTRCAKFINDDSKINEIREEKQPWHLMNEILKKYKFKYYIKKFDSSLSPLKIEFTDGHITIPAEGLSSGEQQLISLVAWAHHEVVAQNIKVLLLDEPDSHLHPNFCRIFVEIMNKYIVEKYDIQVVMATHSPSTIAYASEDSIFVMNMPEDSNLTNRIIKQTKDEALRILSDGLMIITHELVGIIGDIFNNSSKHLLLCEGKLDKMHIEQCLLHDDDLKKKFDNIILIDMGGVTNFKVLHPFLRQINRDKSDTTVLLDNDTEGNKIKEIAKKHFKVILLKNGDIEVCTKLKDNADLFKEWIKKNHSILLDSIDNSKILKPSGNEKELDSLFIKYLKGDAPKNKIPNPLNNNIEEEATNVFKNLWSEYLKTNPDLSKDIYQDLINLLKNKL